MLSVNSEPGSLAIGGLPESSPQLTSRGPWDWDGYTVQVKKKREVISLRRVIYPGLSVALLTELHQSLFATAFIPIFHGDIAYSQVNSDCAVDTLAGTSGNPSKSHSSPSDTKLESFRAYSDCSRSNPIHVSTSSRKYIKKGIDRLNKSKDKTYLRSTTLKISSSLRVPAQVRPQRHE